MHFVVSDPKPIMILPFGVLLGLIALAPLFFLHWWEKHYPKVALALGATTLSYYFFRLHDYHTVMLRQRNTLALSVWWDRCMGCLGEST